MRRGRKLRRMEKRFCPKCKSENVKLETGSMYGTPGNWVCNNCGFHNVEFPIKGKLNKKLK